MSWQAQLKGEPCPFCRVRLLTDAAGRFPVHGDKQHNRCMGSQQTNAPRTSEEVSGAGASAMVAGVPLEIPQTKTDPRPRCSRCGRNYFGQGCPCGGS